MVESGAFKRSLVVVVVAREGDGLETVLVAAVALIVGGEVVVVEAYRRRGGVC